MNFFNNLKKYSHIKTFFIMILVGIVFTFGGILGIKSNSSHSEWAETTATIESIDTQIYDENTIYEVTVTYYDENNEKHTAVLSDYDFTMKKGSSIKVRYDPTDYENVESVSGGWMFYGLTGLGAVLIIVGLVITIKAIIKPAKDYNLLDKVDNSSATPSQIESIKENKSPIKHYIYHFTGKLGQSQILKTVEGIPVYEAVCAKMGILSLNKFTFINHLTNKITDYEIGHTITTTEGSRNLALETDYHFSINGENCWEYLGKLGYSLNPHLEDYIHVKFDVLHFGIKVGTIESGSTNDVPGAKQYKWGNIPTASILKVQAKKEDLDAVFLACFIISRR